MKSPLYLQLHLAATEANRLYWRGQYFSLEAVLVFSKQIEAEQDAQTSFIKSSLVFKMTPFETQFRAKMLASLMAESSMPPQLSTIIGLTVAVDISQLKVFEILDFRTGQSLLDSQGIGTVASQQSEQVTLTLLEKTELLQALQQLVQGNLKPHLQQPFISFFSELVDEQSQQQIAKQVKKSALVPFQALFPYSGEIKRIYAEKTYILGDLYCIKPNCNCNEVTCFILTIDPKSGQEVTHGGFKYHLTKQTFKNLPNFPTNLNLQEWFKQFSMNHSMALPVLFRSRYDFASKRLALNKFF